MFLNTLIKSYSPASPGKKIHYDIEIMTYFHNKGWRFLAKRHQNKIFYKYGCEIIRGADIDKSARFQHITGVVIGSHAKIGKNVYILQHVTIGSNIGSNRQGDKLAMPTIEDNVLIYAGAVIAGGITVGEGSVIGANSIVTKSVPKRSLVTGINQVSSLE